MVSSAVFSSASQSDNIGIYIHWPFCASKCPYCDFNSHVRESIDHIEWQFAYIKEIRHYASLTRGRRVGSIFFGGGTPSLMDTDTVRLVVDEVTSQWPVTDDLEITLEANPTSVEAKKFAAFKEAGINRVSMGIQALNDEDLKFLGRHHNVKEALQALDIASQYFDRYSFDLIYARPKQSVEKWRQELEKALSFQPSHMSLYQLTIEPGTPFFTQHRRGDFAVPDEDRATALYEVTQERMAQAKMPAYEISNHARAGEESRHNLVYWEYADYVGIGPGAHGRLTLGNEKVGTRGHAAPEIWLERVSKDGHGGHPYEKLSRKARFTETLMMGLRLNKGVRLAKLSYELDAPWQSALPQAKLDELVKKGFLVIDDERITATLAGRQRLDSLLPLLV